jgi:heptosyltransferase-2
MALPAVQSWRRAHPDDRLTVLAKPGPAALWRIHAAPDEVWTWEPGFRGFRAAVRRVRAAGLDAAWILPHSFRSGVTPWLAGVPRRIGMPGHFRDGFLTECRPPLQGPGRRHQQFEYFDLFGLPDTAPEPPRLRIPEEATLRIRALFAGAGPGAWAAIMPGAARGPSKCWPADRFGEVARRLASEAGLRICVCGGASEAEACAAVTRAAGGGALNLAGRTSLAEWAALLAACRIAVANDSGGMHLAAAAGTRVAAIFGRTDPGVTGPLGAGHEIVQAPGARSRAIARNDSEASARLNAVTVEAVMDACIRLLNGPESPPP